VKVMVKVWNCVLSTTLNYWCNMAEVRQCIHAPGEFIMEFSLRDSPDESIVYKAPFNIS
jgi:hypothetical protein